MWTTATTTQSPLPRLASKIVRLIVIVICPQITMTLNGRPSLVIHFWPWGKLSNITLQIYLFCFKKSQKISFWFGPPPLGKKIRKVVFDSFPKRPPRDASSGLGTRATTEPAGTSLLLTRWVKMQLGGSSTLVKQLFPMVGNHCKSSPRPVAKEVGWGPWLMFTRCQVLGWSPALSIVESKRLRCCFLNFWNENQYYFQLRI